MGGFVGSSVGRGGGGWVEGRGAGELGRGTVKQGPPGTGERWAWGHWQGGGGEGDGILAIKGLHFHPIPTLTLPLKGRE